MNFLKALRKRHIALLWISQILSAMGDYFYEIAVIWIAIKSVGSGAGIIAAAEAGSMLIFGLLGGVYADRWDRRKVMIIVDLVRAGAVATLPLLAWAGPLPLWYLTIVAIIIGSLGSLFNPALQASLSTLSGDVDTLQATNGLMDVTTRLALTLGPSLAGLLVALMPLPQFFTIDAVSFIISAVAILSLGRHFVWKPQQQTTATAGIRGIVGEIAGAARLVLAHPSLAWILLTSCLMNFLWSIAFIVGVPLFVDRVLISNVGAYGLIFGAYGLGNVLSNLVIGSIHVRRRLPMIFSGTIIIGLGFLLFAFSRNLPLAMFANAFAAIGGPMEDIMRSIMIQTELPPEQIGKVFSLNMVLSNVGSTIGLLIAVPLFTHFSVMLTIGLCALLMIAAGVIGLLRFGFSVTEQKPAMQKE